MFRFRKSISYTLVLGISMGAIQSAPAQAGSESISTNVSGSPLIVSASSDRFAGAIESLVFRGVQYVNIADHGRQIQSAIQLDNLGECLNPNEAGSEADGALYTSSSVLHSILSSNNVLTTLSQPAFWLAPGENYGEPCSPYTTISTAQNTTILSNYRISRTTSFYGPSIPNLLEITTTFTVPENRTSASVEGLTSYLPPSFTNFLTYDRNERRLTKLTVNSSIQRTSTPIIVSLPNGSSSMGVLSNSIPSSDPSKAAYYAYIYYPGSQSTAKWSCVFAENNLLANTTYAYSCPITVGTVDEVIAAMDAYPGANQNGLLPVFRFYKYPQHFMTRSYSEAAGAGFIFETTGFRLYQASGSGRAPLFRCFNSSNGDHFVSTQANCEGLSVEGILGYAATSQVGNLVPLYRFYKVSTADHLTTINYSEGVNGGYTYEGVLGYVAS